MHAKCFNFKIETSQVEEHINPMVLNNKQEHYNQTLATQTLLLIYIPKNIQKSQLVVVVIYKVSVPIDMHFNMQDANCYEDWS